MFNNKKVLEILSDSILHLNKALIKQQEFDNHQTHRANVHDGLIGKVENDLDQLRDDIRLIMEYLGVHKEVINETFLMEDDCICDECCEDNLEDVKKKK